MSVDEQAVQAAIYGNEDAFALRAVASNLLMSLLRAEQERDEARADLQRYADLFERRGAQLAVAQPVLDAAAAWLTIGMDERKAVAFVEAEDVLATVVAAYVASPAPTAGEGSKT